MEPKNINKTSKNNISYYLGIWNSNKWEKAEELLKRKYTEKDYNELFCLYSKYKKIPNIKKLIELYGKEPILEFTLPIIQSLALSSKEIKKEIPILTDHIKEIIELTQFEGASILATFFLNMFGNFNQGRKEELKNLGYDQFPDLSFEYYLMNNDRIFIQKLLFVIRYFIKIGIRMGVSKKLKIVDHANFMLSKESILEKLKKYNNNFNEIYDFKNELEIDCNNEINSILKIYLNEFNPILYNKSFEEKNIDNDILCDELNKELNVNKMYSEIKKNNNKYLKEIENVFLNKNEKITINYLKTQIKIHTNSITDEKNSIITNFANSYLGGGCMHYGNVQEEILLLICPEILIARAFVKRMNNIQSISMSGFEIISKSIGYGSRVKFGGYNIDNSYENNSFKSLMIAVDAYPNYNNNYTFEINPIYSLRELIKFLTGLQGNNNDILNYKFDFCSTGKWGCGAFGCNVFMKFLIQFIACIFSNIGFSFSCFSDEEEQKVFEKFIDIIIKITEENEDKITQGLIFKTFLSMDIDKNTYYNGTAILNEFIETLTSLIKQNN